MAMSSAEKSARYREKNVEAYRKRKRELARRPKHRAKRAEYMRRYRKLNRKSFNEMCRRSHAKARKRRTPEQRHAQHLWATYGIKRETYLEMLERQKGQCLICKSPKPRGPKSWHVDHCHETGRIRGLLCNYCNPRLGWYETFKSKIEAYLKL
jgi:Recombination endonuclease VII